MATTGRRTVAPGQVVAADWGNVVWDQSVQQFDSAAQRATQYPSPLPGAVTYLADKARLEKYANSRWEAVTPNAAGSTPWIAIVPYVGQPIIRVVGTQTLATDASGVAILLASSSISGGVLGVGLSGTAIYCITAAFGNGGNNVYAKLFNGSTIAANTGISVTWWADCYTAT